MKIENLEVDQLGKDFGDDGRGSVLSIVIEGLAMEDNEYAVRVEGADRESGFTYDSISLKELSSALREAADWLDSIPKIREG